ncbi:MAG: PIN domain-containing protein, partial [Verrucomicrobiota bacterium]
MAVLVDTNVISDVILRDSNWEDWSIARLAEYCDDLCINPIIFAELCCRADSVASLEALLGPFRFDYQEIPKEALFLAAKAFATYRKRSGTKQSPLPDFFVGAHALILDIPILTRDTARYRTYFYEVDLISPT